MQPAFSEFRKSRKSRKPKGIPGAPQTAWVFVEFHQSGIPRKPKPFPAPGSPLEFWAGPGSQPRAQVGARGWKRLGFSWNSTFADFHENPTGFGGPSNPLGYSRNSTQWNAAQKDCGIPVWDSIIATFLLYFGNINYT